MVRHPRTGCLRGSAFRLHALVSSQPWRVGLPSLSRQRIHDVGFDSTKARVPNEIEVCVAHKFAVTRFQFFHRTSIPGSKDCRPPGLRRRNRMFAWFRRDLCLVDAALVQQCAQGRRVRDAIPRISSFIEVRAYFTYRVRVHGSRPAPGPVVYENSLTERCGLAIVIPGSRKNRFVLRATSRKSPYRYQIPTRTERFLTGVERLD